MGRMAAPRTLRRGLCGLSPGAARVSGNNPRAPILLDLYQKYLDNQDSGAFIRKVSRRYCPATLQRLAENGWREVRRAAVLALGFLAGYELNHILGRALNDEDRTVRLLAENGIRSLWSRDGSDQQRQRLGIIVRLNSAQHYEEAARQATDLIEEAPWFAEAWNQRAVAHFNLEDYVEAIRDCHQALELNPYHFLAATAMGQAYLQLGNRVSALESFRRALRINPNLEGVRAQVDRLTRMIGGK
jgi:tetratricopeptide (TPR) repeat protein